MKSAVIVCVLLVVLATVQVPGEWVTWNSWSLCSKTCGGGMRMRQRECNMTSYDHLTIDCLGNKEAQEVCFDFSCNPGSSCTDLRQRGLTQSGMCDIRPQGSDKPFRVYCDMEAHGGQGVTELRHNLMNSTLVSGFESECEFWRKVEYHNIDVIAQAKALVQVSKYCEQYLQWRCRTARIHREDGKEITYWVNADGKIMKYWAGADPKSNSCACGNTQSCGNGTVPTLRCNCDANDPVWREDSGLITNKDDLPISKFCAGDTGGTQEMGYFQIGPLACRGKKT